MMLKTSLGSGLAGIAALYAFPPLRRSYFIALSTIFTFTGCFVSVTLARWRFNPAMNCMLKLQSALLEIAQINGAEKPEPGLIASLDAAEK